MAAWVVGEYYRWEDTIKRSEATTKPRGTRPTTVTNPTTAQDTTPTVRTTMAPLREVPPCCIKDPDIITIRIAMAEALGLATTTNLGPTEATLQA